MFLKNVLLLGVADTIMVPQRCPVLFPGTCEYVHLHGKRNFAELDVIKFRILRRKIILDFLGGSNRITKLLVRER